MDKREIKFRVWDTQATGWLVPSCVAVLGSGYGQYYNGAWRSLDIKDRYQVMQFTGLLDKDGKEIYEGDLLQGRYFSRPLVVVYHTESCSFDLQDLSGHHGEHLFDTTGQGDLGYNFWEVLGNRFENPELLNGENNDLPTM